MNLHTSINLAVLHIIRVVVVASSAAVSFIVTLVFSGKSLKTTSPDAEETPVSGAFCPG